MHMTRQSILQIHLDLFNFLSRGLRFGPGLVEMLIPREHREKVLERSWTHAAPNVHIPMHVRAGCSVVELVEDVMGVNVCTCGDEGKRLFLRHSLHVNTKDTCFK